MPSERQDSGNFVEVGGLLVPVTRWEDMLRAMTEPLTRSYADPENQREYEEWLAKRRASRKEK